MQKIVRHIRTYIIRGLLAMTPLILSAIAVTLLYNLVDQRVISFLEQFFDVKHIPGFGLFIVLLALFIIGFIATNVVGKEILHGFESLSRRIPVIKHIYTLSRQIGDALIAAPDHQVFKKGILINYPNANQWTIALTTGVIQDHHTGENWVKAYVPMPHPVVGFIYLVKEKDVIDPGWSSEETFKMILSLGLITPKITVS